MARIRTIKPDYWTDERVGECSVSARLLFIACWNFADDHGGLDRSSKQLKAQAFPYDSIDCEPLVQELLSFGLLVEYEVGGKKYLHVKGFRKHQKVEKPARPRVPVYDDSLNSRGGLPESSPTSSGLFSGREGKGKEQERQLAAERPSVRSRFAEFWEPYPKKVKRKDAEKVWQSKRLDGMADALIADVKRRRAEDRRWLGGFVPDPPTYLRGERWNDAIEAPAKNGNGQHAADAAAKERTQILDLASMFGIEQGGEDWPTFKARVERANERRLASLGA